MNLAQMMDLNARKYPDKVSLRYNGNGITFGELYSNPIEKLDDIQTRGYKVVTCWEIDWLKLKRSITILQKIWKTRNNENPESRS